MISFTQESHSRLSKAVFENSFVGYHAFQKLLRNKDIKINGQKTKNDVEVFSGDCIEIYYDQNKFICYQDTQIAVLKKPKGVKSETTQIMFPHWLLCHRLDTNTDGLIIMAKNEKAFSEIVKAFKEENIDKFYRAKVYGKFEKTGKYFAYLLKDANVGKVSVSDSPVKNSVAITTEIVKAEFDGACSHLEILIHRGKTHQIRAHLAFLGHFILGDSKYGNDKTNRQFNEAKLQLTAFKILFHFPKTSYLSYLNDLELMLDRCEE